MGGLEPLLLILEIKILPVKNYFPWFLYKF